MTFIKYISKQFFPLFFGSLFFLSFTITLVDLLMNLWQYLLEGANVPQILKISLYYMPKAISFAAPLAILFATAYTLSALYARHELTAIFSAGVPLIKFTMPILIFSLIASVGSFFFDDYIVVPTYKEKIDLQKIALNEMPTFDNSKLVILADGGNIVYRCDNYDDTKKTLSNITIFIRTEDKQLDKIVMANDATWQTDRWIFNNPKTYSNIDGELVFSTGTDFISFETPDNFKNEVISIEEVTLKEGKEYIDKLKRIGLPHAEERAQYHKKFAFPFVIFITVFLSIGLSGKSKKNVLLVSLALCISAAVLFYVFQMVTVLMANFGYLSPLAGAWMPVIVFVALSIVLLRFAKT